MTDHTTIERYARRLCAESRGNWAKRRAYWMRKAQRLTDQARAVATAEAVMAIFGLRRVK